MRRSALTLIEVLVVLAIIGILIAMLLPAVQYAREASRRMQCASNLRQIAIGMHSYEGIHRSFPPGNASTYSYLVAILPEMDKSSLFGEFDFSIYATDMSQHNKSILTASFPDYRCPSDGVAQSRPYKTTYFGNIGYDVLSNGFNGLFHGENISSTNPVERGTVITPGEVTDGLSNTALVGEALVSDAPASSRLRTNWSTALNFGPGEHEQFCSACLNQEFLVTSQGNAFGDNSRGGPWYEGAPGVTLYNHSLPPNSLSCLNGSSVTYGIYSLGSNHPGGAQVAFADGHVVLVSSLISRQLWRAMGTRAGNEVDY